MATFDSFQKLSDQPCRFPGKALACQEFVTFIKRLDLIDTYPVHLGDIAAQDAPFNDVLLKTFQKFPRKKPEPHVFLICFVAAAEQQAEDSQGANQGTADLPITAQPAAEGPHGLDQ